MSAGRPRVELRSPNQCAKMLEALESSLWRFTALEGVVGVMLDGGLSRGYGDELSEIDVVIFLREASYRKYAEGACPFALGIAMIDGWLYDTKLLCFEEEAAREYEPVALWDLSYARVLYDPEGALARMIADKLSRPVEPSAGGALLWDAYWHYRLAGDIWIHRGDAWQGHYILNRAIGPLLGALFVANAEYVPHDKWLVHMSRTLAWKPEGWDAALASLLGTGNGDVQSLIARQQAIDALWQKVNRRLCEQTGFDVGLNFPQKASYEALVRLLEKREYTLEEWQATQELEALNYEPLHSIFRREGNLIILDEDSFLSLKPDSLYVWMYEIAAAARRARG